VTRRRRISLLALLFAALVAAIPVAEAAPGARAKPKALKLRTTSLGRVLVDAHGRTLYMFGHDLTDVSRCSGACAANWPPATAPRKPRVARGIKQSKLKVIRRGDGTRQLSFAGHPLYRYSGDGKPGDVNGEGINAFGGVWHAVTAQGKAASQPSSGSTGNTGNPYPYPYP
jgi:predicted lipoprotein with Yx(FWY)xxD motif